MPMPIGYMNRSPQMPAREPIRNRGDVSIKQGAAAFGGDVTEEVDAAMSASPKPIGFVEPNPLESEDRAVDQLGIPDIDAECLDVGLRDLYGDEAVASGEAELKAAQDGIQMVKTKNGVLIWDGKKVRHTTLNGQRQPINAQINRQAKSGEPFKVGGKSYIITDGVLQPTSDF